MAVLLLNCFNVKRDLTYACAGLFLCIQSQNWTRAGAFRWAPGPLSSFRKARTMHILNEIHVEGNTALKNRAGFWHNQKLLSQQPGHPLPGTLLREPPSGQQREAAHYKERLAELHSASLCFWFFDFFYLKIVCLPGAFPQILPICEHNLINRTFYITNSIY